MKQQPYHPGNDHFECFFICATWEEPITPSRWRLALNKFLRIPLPVKFERKYTNQVLDVPPIWYAVRMLATRRNFTITHSSVISKKLYLWTTAMLQAATTPPQPQPQPEQAEAQPAQT